MCVRVCRGRPFHAMQTRLAKPKWSLGWQQGDNVRLDAIGRGLWAVTLDDSAVGADEELGEIPSAMACGDGAITPGHASGAQDYGQGWRQSGSGSGRELQNHGQRQRKHQGWRRHQRQHVSLT